MQIYQEMSWSHLGAEVARARKSFYHHLVTSKTIIMTKSAQATIFPNHHKAVGLSRIYIYNFLYGIKKP